MIMLVGGSDDATTAHQQDGVNLKLVIALMLICGAVWIRTQVHGISCLCTRLCTRMRANISVLAFIQRMGLMMMHGLLCHCHRLLFVGPVSCSPDPQRLHAGSKPRHMGSAVCGAPLATESP